MRNWLAAFLALSCSLSSWSDPEIIEHQIADDGWVEVPLDFTFPFYGNMYVTSFMFSNGVVGFLDPNDVPGSGYVYDGLCCDGPDLTSFTGVRFNYTIMPWSTDLIDTGVGRFYTQGDSTYQKYMWKDLSEYYDVNTKNTFDLTIFPLGNIEVNYETIHIKNHGVTVGVVGDLSAGEYEQWFYNAPNQNGAVYWDSQEADPVEIAGGESICSVIPDSHISCLYYPQVYADNVYIQQCNLDPLYDYGCAGWSDAYLNQQCGISALYDESCNGWDDAYYEEYVEPEEEEVWEVEEEDYEVFVLPEPEPYIEIAIEPIEDYTIVMSEIEMQLPEIEMVEITQQEFEAELEAELEEYFELEIIENGNNESSEEPISEPNIEDESSNSDEEPERSSDDVNEPEPEETLEEENNNEEEINEPLEEEESEESTDEEPVEPTEEQEEIKAPEAEAVEETKLVEKKKKASKKDKMREIISNKLQGLAIEMGEAVSLEEQQKLQSLILALLNFNSEFSSYNSQLADSIFYDSKDIYTGRQVPDNQRGLRNGLANEILHNKLVDLQWQK